MNVETSLIDRIERAPVAEEPFPHFVLDDVFPGDFYEAIVDHWPEESSWRALGESGRVSKGQYAERLVLLMNDPEYARLDEARRRFWRDTVGSWLLGARLRTALVEKFARELAQSGFGARPEETIADALIVSDRTGYAIGPHTDAPHRVVSLLFYLPEDAAFSRFGTSFYAPRDAGFRCNGGPHHPFGLFDLVKTVGFVPNRLVVFPKSDRCFHGVEPVDLPGIERRLLIYNVRRAG